MDATLTHNTVNAGRISGLVPLMRIAGLKRSLRFYRELGFLVTETNHEGVQINWVTLESGTARIVLAPADTTNMVERQAVPFYLYSEGLDELRERLLSHGYWAEEITGGRIGGGREMRVSDPDGYDIVIVETDDRGSGRF